MGGFWGSWGSQALQDCFPSSSTLVCHVQALGLAPPVQQTVMGCWMGWGGLIPNPPALTSTEGRCIPSTEEWNSIHAFSTTEEQGLEHLHPPHLCCANLQHCCHQPDQDSQIHEKFFSHC